MGPGVFMPGFYQCRGAAWGRRPARVAKELPRFQPRMLTNVEPGGPLIGFPRVMLPTQWLGLPIVGLVRARSP